MKPGPLFVSIFIMFLLVACNPGQTNLPERTSEAAAVPTLTLIPTLVPSPTASSPSLVHVLSDGSGDYASLEAAVEAVAAWSTIFLGEGTFRLEETLEISKPLSLVGAGADKTTVVGEGSVAVVRYQGDDLFTIRDVTFRHEGDFAAGVIVIESGEVHFSQCRLSNGSSSEDDEVGVGLIFLNDSAGVVKDCEIDENAEYGIVILNQAKPELSQNKIHDNGRGGIYYQIDENGGTAKRNDLDGNGLADFGDGTDIFLFGPFAPILESNSCSNEGFFSRSSALGNASGIFIVSRSELPAESNLWENKCPVTWCSTPTGSLLSMTCQDHR
jgi:parallel beta-helix repeat protein